MRIDSLDLIAFGPFSDTHLDFSAGAEGLHLVFGNNEAGKSSALRALGDLLYGIPNRTIDAFHHPHPKLRLGARLRNSDQSVIEFVRRKGRTPLRCVDDKQPLQEAQLDAFRPVADRELFETMFALNHERLVQGGRHILEGGGRLGELLFEAGTGLGNLKQIQAQLKEEIESLYLPKGRNPRINKTLSCLRETRTQIKQAALVADDWMRLARQLDDKRARLRELDQQIQREESHHQRLVRLQEAIPCAVRRNQLQSEIDQLHDVVPVHSEQVREISNRLAHRDALVAQLEDLREERDTFIAKKKEIRVHPAAVHESESLNQYREWLGSYRKALNDRPELETKRRLTEQRISDGLKSLGYEVAEHADHPTIENHVATRIQDRGAQYEVLRERLNHRRRHASKLQRELEELQKERDALTVIDGLATLERRVNLLADPQSLLDQSARLRARGEEIEASYRDRLARLPGWTGTIEQLVRLEVPTRETVSKHNYELQSARKVAQTRTEQVEDIQTSIGRLSGQLKLLEKGQQIPTETELMRLRAVRDGHWEDLRNLLASAASEQQMTEKRDLIDQAIQSLRSELDATDLMADRLRREADRVAEKARILAEQESLRQQLQPCEQQRREADQALASANAAWREVWSPLVDTPLTPDEMMAWLELYRELCGLYDDDRSVQFEQREISDLITQLSQKVDELVEDCHEPEFFEYEIRPDRDSHLPASYAGTATETLTSGQLLIDRIGRLQSFMKQASLAAQQREQLKQRCRALESDLREAESDSREAESGWKQWQAEWQREMQRLQLPHDAPPTQANSVLTALADLAAEATTVRELDVRISGIDNEASEFEQKIRRIAKRIGDAIGPLPETPESLATALFEFLDQNRLAQQELDQVTSQHESVAREIQQRTSQMKEIDATLASFAKQLHVAEPGQLLQSARQGERLAELETKCQGLDESLTSLCGGKTIDRLWEEVIDGEPTLEAEASSEQDSWNDADVDLLNAWSKAAERRIDHFRETRDELIREVVRDQTEFEKMNGGGDAAALEQRMQESQMDLSSQIRELQVLRLMDVGLRTAMARYRDQNELPILKRASELFADLTTRRYVDLRLDADEQGEPIVVGVRTTGDIVHVNQMSDGTRDQLYLAIRLASLDQWVENREPMLFVLDDVLLNFDDERAAACLRTFANYASKIQIIMFTHHAHLVELARDHLDAQSLFVHELDSKYPFA